MPTSPELLPGAIIVTDAHVNPERREFLSFLRAIEEKRLDPPQLLLLGDMFDILIGALPQTVAWHREAIERINRISQRIPLYYFEGNHDYLLKELFPDATVLSLYEQPLFFTCGGKQVAVSHGDRYAPPGYHRFHKLLRCAPLLRFLDWFTLNRWHGLIPSALARRYVKKEICKPFDKLEAIARKRVGTHYREADLVVEGHFHQGKVFQIDGVRYENPGSFACDRSFYVVESTQDEIRLQPCIYEEKTWAKANRTS